MTMLAMLVAVAMQADNRAQGVPPQPSVPIAVRMYDAAGQGWDWPNAAELYAWIEARNAAIRAGSTPVLYDELRNAHGLPTRPVGTWNRQLIEANPRLEYRGRFGFLRFRLNRRGC